MTNPCLSLPELKKKRENMKLMERWSYYDGYAASVQIDIVHVHDENIGYTC